MNGKIIENKVQKKQEKYIGKEKDMNQRKNENYIYYFNIVFYNNHNNEVIDYNDSNDVSLNKRLQLY